MKMLLPKSFMVLSSLVPMLLFTHHHEPPTSATVPEKVEKTELCQMENQVFQPGEEITYQLYYNWNFVWLSAGEVTFQVSEAGDKYHLSAHGRTYPSYEWFFKVRDYYDCFVDKETLLPSMSIRDIHEGDYELYDRLEFHQGDRKVVSHRGKTSKNTEANSYSLDGCIHDVLSIIYYARNIDYNQHEVNAQFPVQIFMDKKTYDLNVKYLGKEEKTKVKKLGKFKTIKFSPEVIAGRVFKDDDQMVVWVTDDQNRIPLLIESPVSVGSIKAVLSDYKGLKYEMTAKR